MEYYKLDNAMLGGIDINCCVSVISIVDGKKILIKNPSVREKAAFCTSSNIMFDDSNRSMKELLSFSFKLESGHGIDEEPSITKISKKEYYSLLD